jgi:hypothetical protein
MAINIKKEAPCVVKKGGNAATRLAVQPLGQPAVHPTVVSAYILETAVRKIQEYLASTGKVLCADKVGVLICNLRLLAKATNRRTKGGPNDTELFDSISARGISGAIEAAIQLLPVLPEAERALQLLGQFSSFDDHLIAPKGTRASITDLLTELERIHQTK